MIKRDCRYFLGTKPCIYHKKEKVKCDNCNYYSKIEYNILIIKLEAIGDVLRTTSILPSLKNKYPNCFITWITKEEALELFINNNYVDRVITYQEALFYSQLLKFNILINLELSQPACLLATITNADKKLGFGLDTSAKIICFNKESEEYLLMSLFDDIKKENNKTYQEIIHNICQIPIIDNKIILNLTDEEKLFAKRFAEKNNIKEDELVIGLNTGAGVRWMNKKWTEEGFISLIKLIIDNLPKAKILLYGSELEKQRNDRIEKHFQNLVINTGYNNTLREFFALLNLSSIVVTSDTLALHAALALNKKVIALFGPTAHQEVEMYNQGYKIIPDLPCICCYKEKCFEKPNCMESIKPTDVFDKILKLL